LHRIAELADLQNLLLPQDVVNFSLEDACRISEPEWKSSELILSSVYRERCFLTVDFSERNLTVAGLQVKRSEVFGFAKVPQYH